MKRQPQLLFSLFFLFFLFGLKFFFCIHALRLNPASGARMPLGVHHLLKVEGAWPGKMRRQPQRRGDGGGGGGGDEEEKKKKKEEERRCGYDSPNFFLHTRFFDDCRKDLQTHAIRHAANIQQNRLRCGFPPLWVRAKSTTTTQPLFYCSLFPLLPHIWNEQNVYSRMFGDPRAYAARATAATLATIQSCRLVPLTSHRTPWEHWQGWKCRCSSEPYVKKGAG